MAGASHHPGIGQAKTGVVIRLASARDRALSGWEGIRWAGPPTCENTSSITTPPLGRNDGRRYGGSPPAPVPRPASAPAWRTAAPRLPGSDHLIRTGIAHGRGGVGDVSVAPESPTTIRRSGRRARSSRAEVSRVQDGGRCHHRDANHMSDRPFRRGGSTLRPRAGKAHSAPRCLAVGATARASCRPVRHARPGPADRNAASGQESLRGVSRVRVHPRRNGRRAEVDDVAQTLADERASVIEELQAVIDFDRGDDRDGHGIVKCR